MNIDTTIPGTSAESTVSGVAQEFGVAGTVAIVGCFEYGDGNTPYYARSGTEALRIMGDDPDFTGTKAIELVTRPVRQTELGRGIESNGAARLILCKAGASVGAHSHVIDTTQTPVDIMVITLKGGVVGNSYTLTTGSGTISGKKFILTDDHGDDLYVLDNLVDNQDLYDRLTAIAQDPTSPIATVTEGDLSKTLKTVTAQAFASGTETAAPDATDLENALDALIDEPFDYLVFTDQPTDAMFPTVEAYLDDRFDNDRATRAVLPVSDGISKSAAITLMATADTHHIAYVDWNITLSDGQILDEVQSAQYYAGISAGALVTESLTNKVITDIAEVKNLHTKADIYDYTYGGMTCLKRVSAESGQYKVVSAVTGSQEMYGTRKIRDEWYTEGVINYTMNYLNVEDMLGETTLSKSSLEGFILQRLNELKDGGMVKNASFTVTLDTDPEVLIVDLDVEFYNVIKHIHKRMRYGGA